jgi:hypothetical protein
MKVIVEKWLNDNKIVTANATVESAADLKQFLTKLEVSRSDEDIAFDFDVYFEKTYSVYKETSDGQQTH